MKQFKDKTQKFLSMLCAEEKESRSITQQTVMASIPVNIIWTDGPIYLQELFIYPQIPHLSKYPKQVTRCRMIGDLAYYSLTIQDTRKYFSSIASTCLFLVRCFYLDNLVTPFYFLRFTKHGNLFQYTQGDLEAKIKSSFSFKTYLGFKVFGNYNQSSI